MNTRYTSLKKRALKLKEQREENINQKEQQKKKELEEEERLEAKVVLAPVTTSENKSNSKRVVKNKLKKSPKYN